MSVILSEAQRSRAIPWHHLSLMSQDSSSGFGRAGTDDA